MPRSKIILSLGFFIALLPVLGFPHSWESFFDVACGLLIVLLSVLITIDRRITLKAKAQKRHGRKKVLAEAETEVIAPNQDTNFHPAPAEDEVQPIERQILNEESQA